jgi:hypothetical protein
MGRKPPRQVRNLDINEFGNDYATPFPDFRTTIFLIRDIVNDSGEVILWVFGE